MVKSIAEKHGLRATFMPKPFPTSPAMAATCTSRCGRRTARTCSKTRRTRWACRKLGYQFIGGLMNSAEALAAITNPTVNSYKRINAPRTTLRRDLGAEHRDLYRQQPHPHDPHSRRRPLRAPPRRRRGQSLSAAGGDAGRGPRRHRAASAIRASASTSTCTPRATR